MQQPENKTSANNVNTDIHLNRDMQKLPRLSVWTVLGLTIITFGLYHLYWMLTRSRIINQIQDKKVPSILINAVFGLMLLNLSFAFISSANPDDLDAAMHSNIINVIYSLVNLYWIFLIRDRILLIANANKETGFWIHGFLTFLFQVLYMQYKINQYHDTNPTEATLAG